MTAQGPWEIEIDFDLRVLIFLPGYLEAIFVGNARSPLDQANRWWRIPRVGITRSGRSHRRRTIRI